MNIPATSALPYSITGTANQFISTRFDSTEELGGKDRWAHSFFTRQMGADDLKAVGITNMKQPAQIEAGHQFVVNAIELKVWQRLANANGGLTIEATSFYQDVIQTLFAYSALRFKKSGIDYIGEYPLRRFIPNITSNYRVQTINPVQIDLTNAVSMENHVTDDGRSYLLAVPKAMPIILPEQQNFSVELEGAIPQRIWTGSNWMSKAEVIAAGTTSGDATIGNANAARLFSLPLGLVVAINLWGVETSLQS